MDERKQEMLRWLDELGQYADENGLSSRIMDGIEACKADLKSGNVEMDKIQLEAEQLLDSIRKKAVPEPVRDKAAEGRVAFEDVERQIKKMAQRCHDENESSIQDMAERNHLAVKKCEAQLKEILRTDAHLEELKHGAKYIQFYEKAAFWFQKEVSYLASEVFEAMNQNYTHMLDHMRSMFRSLRDSGNETIQEKTLYEMDVKREEIGRKLQADVESWEPGRQEIVSFAERTGTQISQIVKAAERKRKLYAMLPVLVVLVFLLGNIISGAVAAASDAEAAYAETQEADTGTQLGEQLVNQLPDVLETVGDAGGTASGLISVLELIIAVAILVILVILVVVLLYVMYIKLVRRWCDRSIAKKSAEYLHKEFAGFEQSNVLGLALEENIKNAMEEFEQRHLQLFNDTFAVWGSTQEEQKKIRLDELVRKWNSIR